MRVTEKQFDEYLSDHFDSPLDYTFKDDCPHGGIVSIRSIIDRATKRVVGFIWWGYFSGTKWFITDWTI